MKEFMDDMEEYDTLDRDEDHMSDLEDSSVSEDEHSSTSSLPKNHITSKRLSSGMKNTKRNNHKKYVNIAEYTYVTQIFLSLIRWTCIS